MLPDAIKKFIDRIATLPSIGPRQATRLGFYLAGLSKQQIREFKDAFAGLENLKTCSRCFLAHENIGELCAICADTKRDASLIAIVEKETDLISIEQTKKFNGRYLVLGELRNDGVLEAAHKARLATLNEFIDKTLGGKAKELIIALSPTTYGDLNASIIAQTLRGKAEKITRLGRGIPTGGEIEFADEQTLDEALRHRE